MCRPIDNDGHWRASKHSGDSVIEVTLGSSSFAVEQTNRLQDSQGPKTDNSNSTRKIPWGVPISAL